MLLPVERGPGLGQLVVAVARAGDAQRDVGRVGGDLVGDAALLHVVLLRQAQVLLGRDVAEHARAVIGGGGGADAAGDVVVAGEDVGHERAEHVERRAVAEARWSFMLYSIWSNGTWPGPSTMTCTPWRPGALGELAERRQLARAALVGGVGQPAGAQAVAEEKVTSYSRMMSQMSSKISYIGFCLLW
jgi:hypothetical protein